MPRRQGRTPREALEMFRAEGKHEEAEMLARLLDRPRTPSRLDQRRELLPPEVADFIEAQDRRRAAARRLPPLCPFIHHEHSLGCFDPIAAVTG